ncbi:pentapeptide repeat-containing protein [Streptomyces sp. NBC_01190]|uniref:pentapeptide repeat-containing protein n=1 Tax=Streptomyces sp. NBC_01190 TaxID=2903767 RepID=UPI00386C1D71|nr:pentapeptide repeat-containing protein [Streptomyces sp. NBC_01190]
MTVRQASGEQHLTRDGQVTDRYNAAVTNLGDDAEEVRIGGLYALQRIAQDSPRDAPTVVQVISAYIRDHAPRRGKGKTPSDHPANDVDAALRILTAPLNPATRLDLHVTELRGAQVQGVPVRPVEFKTRSGNGMAGQSGAGLSGADLSGADLSGADLPQVGLADANLVGADLSGAYLPGCTRPMITVVLRGCGLG